ncbi:hypothetical protein [Herbaspirillum sp. RV1423]|uniref:hypothetical protein n=1 Tax=Herbaspirillum sp. RV1423 TaxID=1443993 RepID=UPI0004B35272|nr:hypothetical protein [Herbaspirillum sp. RV1423]
MLVEAARDKEAYGALLERKELQLVDYGPKLRKLYVAVETEVEKLVLMVAQEIHSNGRNKS